MNKLKNLISHILAGLCIALCAQQARAQCNIIAKADGCAKVPESFKITGPAVASADSVVWIFSNGNTKGTDVTNSWNAPTVGSPIQATVYANGVAVCTASTSITIHANPIANFRLLSPAVQCFNGNSFLYEDLTATPGNNPIVWREFLFGDGFIQRDSLPAPIPINMGARSVVIAPQGGFLTPIIRVRDSKGCVSDSQKLALIEIKPDLGADFVSPNPKNCSKTTVILTNTSLISKADAKRYWWDFGDSTAGDTSWDNVSHTYTKNGCFSARLVIESKDGCFDTVDKQAACNVNPKLLVSVKNGDVQCAGNQNFIFDHPVVQNATFLWVFDDPPTGPLNIDFRNWNTTHQFSSAGPYDVTFRLNTQGCSFDTVYRVHVKGPGALVERKPTSIIPASQRYQCKIHDTVYFTNNSSYYLNDDSAFNDFYYTVKGAIFQFIDKNKAHVDFDTISLNTGTKQAFTTRSGRSVYVSPVGDTVAIGPDTLVLQGTYLVKGTRESDRDEFNNNGKHVDRIWDFGDFVAPQCTTDSRPIYPINAKYGNTHMAGPRAPAWTYDANGKWYNCNFNRDSLPKHWYTPGQERCYTVSLRLKDTSKKDPNIKSLTASQNDPSMPDSACESTSTVTLPLTGPNANGLRWRGIPCYGPATVYGFTYQFDQTGPSCDREMFWVHFDSLADRVDPTPNVFNLWVPQNNTVVDRNFTPWTAATSNLPPNVGSIFWQYQPAGNYPSKIADKSGWVTIGLRIQNGTDPLTGQPCIDEKWYHNAYRYIQANPGFKFHDAVKRDSLYTFERTCAPQDVYIKRDSTYLPSTNTFTYSSDSIGVEIWNWGDGEIEIDSFYRYNCIGTKCYSYVKRFKLTNAGVPVQTDSVVTRIYDAAIGKTIFLDARDSTPEIFRKHRYTRPDWNRVGHTIIPCQMLPVDSLGITVYRKSCCDNPPFENVNVAITGFFNELNVTDSIVCRNTPIQFFDSARYYLQFPIPVYPYIIDDYDYWGTPALTPTGNPRQRPRPFPRDYEKLRWNFGDGSGWSSSVPNNPVRSYKNAGSYNVQLEYTDSMGCKQEVTRRITVTGVSPNFSFNRSLANCRPTVDFSDTSLMLDPCRLVSNTKCDEIVSWQWNFGDNKPNNQSVSILQNPSKVYTSFGDYEVTLVVETKLGCKDFIKRTISLEGPRPRFEFAADTVGCVPFTVELRNTSINPTANAEWTWYFGDGNFLTTKADTNVAHTYTKAGEYEIILLQNDVTPLGTGSCNAWFPDTAFTGGLYRKFKVKVLPSRQTSFTVSDSVLCVNDSVVFTSTSDTIYSDFTWITGPGGGDTITGTKATGANVAGKKYTTPGTYYIQLRPGYVPAPGEPACPTSAVKPIKVRDVEAKFICDTSQKPFMVFKNQSRNAAKWWWDFGNGNGFEDGTLLPDNPDAKYNYGEKKGFYTVLLAVESPEGCLDTTYCQFDYIYEVGIAPPNVFTPGDGNSLNDFFDVEVKNDEEYNIAVYNRWGERVFEADNKYKLWDGKHMGTGSDCPAGVYFVVINYRLRGENDKTYNGTLTLLRE